MSADVDGCTAWFTDPASGWAARFAAKDFAIGGLAWVLGLTPDQAAWDQYGLLWTDGTCWSGVPGASLSCMSLLFCYKQDKMNFVAAMTLVHKHTEICQDMKTD